jgi:hypothetical protein
MIEDIALASFRKALSFPFDEVRVFNRVIPYLAGSEVISPFSKGGLRGI